MFVNAIERSSRSETTLSLVLVPLAVYSVEVKHHRTDLHHITQSESGQDQSMSMKALRARYARNNHSGRERGGRRKGGVRGVKGGKWQRKLKRNKAGVVYKLARCDAIAGCRR